MSSTIVISIMSEGMPVDKMEETEEGMACPLPTQDPEANMENLDMAEYENNYTEAHLTDQCCGTCSMYNQTEEMFGCIGDDTGEVGYCQSLKFMCSKEKVCDIWAEGGPITSDSQEEYKDIL